LEYRKIGVLAEPTSQPQSSLVPLLQYSKSPSLQYSRLIPMLKFRESTVSSHHNYLVNQMLSPGFLIGNPDSQDEFYFLAEVVLPGESEPKIYSRFYDTQGAFVLEMDPKRIVTNPAGCRRQSFPGGYRIVLPSGESVLSVQTEVFANGFLTRVQGKLYDQQAKLRIEPYYDAVQVHGEVGQWLREPLRKD